MTTGYGIVMSDANARLILVGNTIPENSAKSPYPARRSKFCLKKRGRKEETQIKRNKYIYTHLYTSTCSFELFDETKERHRGVVERY